MLVLGLLMQGLKGKPKFDTCFIISLHTIIFCIHEICWFNINGICYVNLFVCTFNTVFVCFLCNI